MNHSLNNEKYVLAQLEDIKLYVSSYEMKRERKLSFMNSSAQGIYLTDHGTLPGYLTLRGVILLSECSQPHVSFTTMANNNVQFLLNFDSMYFAPARLKSFKLSKRTGSDIVDCEVVLCSFSCTEGV